MWGPNPVLEKLGFGENDRVAIIHTDDIGMCQASVSAFIDLWEAGRITAGAAMVPCPWFGEIAAYCRANPEADMGVHATLTCEWPTFRWGPLSTRDAGTGLLDEEGGLHKTCEALAAKGRPPAVRAELAAQIARARAAGISPTLMDTHMGSVMHAKFYEGFAETALAAGIPPFTLRLEEAQWLKGGYDAESAAVLFKQSQRLEKLGVPLLDRILNVPLAEEEDRLEKTRAVFRTMKPGHLSYFILHPSQDTPELRAICSDWRSRVADYEIFLSGGVAETIEEEGIHLIGCRDLANLMPDWANA